MAYTGEDIPCLRCERKVMSVGIPLNAVVMTVNAVRTDIAPFDIVLCADCTTELAEFIRPSLKDNPGYQAQKDQYQMHERNWRAENGR